MSATRAYFLAIENWSVQKAPSTGMQDHFWLALRLPDMTMAEALQSRPGGSPEANLKRDLEAILAELASISEMHKKVTLAESRVRNTQAGLARFGKMLGMAEASTPEQIIAALETHLMRQALGLPVTTEKK
jgi:hypothetical protein